MSGSLEEPVAKLRRAAEHYRVLKDDFHGGVDRHNQPVMVELDGNGLDYRFRVGEVEPLDPRFTLVLGDAFYNLRSALDYLVFQMHVRRFRGSVPKTIAETCAFPIRDKPHRFKGGRRNGQLIPTDKWTPIKALGRRDRTAIEWLQPYKTRNLQISPRRPIPRIEQLRRTLNDIEVINAIDKHRGLHLVRKMTHSVYAPQFPTWYGFQQHPEFGVTLKSNAYVDRWTFVHPPPSGAVHMHAGIRTAVGIEVGGEHILALEHLGGCIRGVELVFERFQGRFPPLAQPLDLSWVRLTVG